MTKLNASGSALAYSTFLGGTNRRSGRGIAVDEDGRAYVTGHTESADYPTTPGAFDTTFNGGYGDAFVTKLNAVGLGACLLHLPGGDEWRCRPRHRGGRKGRAYVTGITDSADYPTTPGAFDTSFNGGIRQDAFVTKLNASGSALAYSTFLGGTNVDEGYGHRGGRRGQGLRDGGHLLRRLPHHPWRLRHHLQRRQLTRS